MPEHLAWGYVDQPPLIALMGIVLPLAVPVLPVETYIRYAEAIHFPQPRIETHRLGPLPQVYADQFGWEEMASASGEIARFLFRGRRLRT